jgi:hypothetical protein
VNGWLNQSCFWIWYTFTAFPIGGIVAALVAAAVAGKWVVDDLRRRRLTGMTLFLAVVSLFGFAVGFALAVSVVLDPRWRMNRHIVPLVLTN